MNYFYSKLVVTQNIIKELEDLDLSDEEKIHLSNLLDSSIHHAVLDEVLSNLNDNDKELFLKLLHENPTSQKLTDFLEEKIGNIDSKIKKVTGELIEEMHKEVREAKKVR